MQRSTDGRGTNTGSLTVRRWRWGEPFEVDGQKIRFPGDPEAPAHLIWNCRCTTVAQIEGFEKDLSDLGLRHSEKLGGMTYDEWKNAKAADAESITRQEETGEGMRRRYNAEYGSSPQIKGYAEKNYEPVTGEWLTKSKTSNPSVQQAQFYKAADGKEYFVDGNKVVLDPSKEEIDMAELLVREVGETIIINPKINYPQGIRSADYDMRGEHYDLKTLKPGAGPNTIFNRVKKSSGQSKNLILDLTDSGLSSEIIDKQVDKIFWSSDTQFVNLLAIVKNGKVDRVWKRKKN